MLSLTEFSRKFGPDLRVIYELAKIVPLPPLVDNKPPKAGAKKLYHEADLLNWYDKAVIARFELKKDQKESCRN